MREKALNWLIFMVCGCLAPAAHALALSQIRLNSHLNQPLDARVELSGVESGDLASLNVVIHYPDAGNYQQAVPLKHEIKEDARGHYIQITSSASIREPVVTFTLEVDWAKGSMSREYTLLIDPK